MNEQSLKGWEEYIKATDLQMRQRAAGTIPFLWIDELSGRRERVHQGEIPIEPGHNDSPEKVPHGLIHHWIGAIFIPNAGIKSVFAVLNDYDRYNQIYRPAVVNAKLLDNSGPTQRFSVLFVEKAPFVTAAINSEYSSKTTCLDERHCYSISYSTRIQEIDNYGEAGQNVLPPDTGHGFIWRLYSIERFAERDGGVYAEFEAIALSRDIPSLLQWLVKPILRSLPRDSMLASLQKTRDAVSSERPLEKPEVAEIMESADRSRHGWENDNSGPGTSVQAYVPAH